MIIFIKHLFLRLHFTNVAIAANDEWFVPVTIF